MKKIRNILLIMLIGLLVVGCGKDKEEGKTKELDTRVAKEKISALKFKDSDFTFTEEVNYDNKEALKVYGVDTSLFTNSYCYLSNNVVDPSMFLIVKTTDENKAVLKYQIKEMFDKYYSAYNNYYPKEAKMISDRLEKELEGYQVYIVSHDNNLVYQAISESFK